MKRSHWVPLLVVMLGLAGVGTANEAEPPATDAPERAPVEPKPLTRTVEKGLAWLAEHQDADGGWGQGEEAARMRGGGRRGGGEDLRDLPNVADTCMATLTLIRAGSTPSEGPHSTAVHRAVEFVVGQVEAADDESPWVTDVRGTRVQQKIGPHVDTFLAALLLLEVKEHVADERLAERVAAALTRTMGKIERHQQDDGRWAGGGWAGGLSNALAAKAVNRAALFGGGGGGGGVVVDEAVRQRAARSAQERSEPDASGRFADDGRSAGIELYAAASAVGELSEAAQANQQRRRQVEAEREDAARRLAEIRNGLAGAYGAGGGGGGPAAPADADELRVEAERLGARADALGGQLEQFDAAERDLRRALRALEARLDDDGFIAGFGTNGGEEFISYLNIGEALVVQGGGAWERFDRRMTENLGNVQNADGSWTGHHCITGRTFCTSAALLVLMVDRSPHAIGEELTP